MKYKKKPVVIDAIQFTGDNDADIIEFLADDRPNVMWSGDEKSILIPTLEGVMKCGLGNWIIRGVNGELYPCSDDIFRKTYDAVDNRNIEILPNLPFYIEC